MRDLVRTHIRRDILKISFSVVLMGVFMSFWPVSAGQRGGGNLSCYLQPKQALTPEQEECRKQVDNQFSYADYGPCANLFRRQAQMLRCHINDDPAIGAYDCVEIDGKAEYVGTFSPLPYQPCPGVRRPYEERDGYTATVGAIFRDVKARTDAVVPGSYSTHSFLPSCYDCQLNDNGDTFELSRSSVCSDGECLPVDRRLPCFDSDDDGLPDEWEKMYGLNPDDPSDALGDPDNDGLGNIDEFENGTDPLNDDTDGDKMGDKWEVDNKTDPADPSDAEADPDKDGYTNRQEHDSRTDPQDSQSAPVPQDQAGETGNAGGNSGGSGDGTGDGGDVEESPDNEVRIGSISFGSIWVEQNFSVSERDVKVDIGEVNVISLSVKSKGEAWISKVGIKQAKIEERYTTYPVISRSMQPFVITVGIRRNGLEPGDYKARITFNLLMDGKSSEKVYYCDVYMSVLTSEQACLEGKHFKNVALGSAWRLAALRQYQSAIDLQLKETSNIEDKKVIAQMRDSLGYEIQKVEGQNSTAQYIYDYLRNYPTLSEEDKLAIANSETNWDERGLSAEQSQLLENYIASWEQNVFYNDPSSYWEELDKEMRESCPPSTWGISAFFKGAAKEAMLTGMGLISAAYEIVKVPGDLVHDIKLVFVDKKHEVYNLKLRLSELYVTEATMADFLTSAVSETAYNTAYGIAVVGVKQKIWDNLIAGNPEAAGRGLFNFAAFIYGTEKLRGGLSLEKISLPQLSLSDALAGSGGLQFAFEGAQGAAALSAAGVRTVARFNLGGNVAAGAASMMAVAYRRIPVKYKGQNLGTVKVPETRVTVSEVITMPTLTPLQECMTQAVYNIRKVLKYFAPDKAGDMSTLSQISKEFGGSGVKGINIKLNKVTPHSIQEIDLKLKGEWEINPYDLTPLSERASFSISVSGTKVLSDAVKKRLVARVADELSQGISKIALPPLSGTKVKWTLSAAKDKMYLWSSNRAISVIDLEFSFP